MTARRWDRTMMLIAAAWATVLAGITLFPYQWWLRQVPDGLSGDELAALAGASGEVAGLVRVYGGILLVGALVTVLLALRLQERPRRFVLVWLVLCTVCALLTRDPLGVVLFGGAAAIVLARARAVSRVHTHLATHTGRTA